MSIPYADFMFLKTFGKECKKLSESIKHTKNLVFFMFCVQIVSFKLLRKHQFWITLKKVPE